MTYTRQWNLDVVFAGGTGESAALKEQLARLEELCASAKAQISALPVPDSPKAVELWEEALKARDTLFDVAQETGAFIGCLRSQNTKDEQAKLLTGRIGQLYAQLSGVEIVLVDRVRQIPDDLWNSFIAEPRFADAVFHLQEIRDKVKESLAPEQEVLIADLGVDGFQAWGRLYQTLVSRVTVPVEKNGEVKHLSAPQAYNEFPDPDPKFRAKLMTAWEESWGKDAELFASALNHIGGFRLTSYRHHGWDSVLARALKGNRMQAETLQAMWDAINAKQDRLLAYFKRKAQMIGVDSLHWYDEHAPLGNATKEMSFDEAADFVVEQFGAFHPGMAAFAKHALDNGWVESEDRPNKGAGAYCTGLPLSKASRVFMTFGKTHGADTLAHELGHAYHNHVQWDLPKLARGFTMSTAETASTFAELLVAAASRRQAETQEEKVALLDQSIRQTVTMFMNIQSRFLFETRFYEERKKGLLSVDRLNQLMLDAQKEAFGNGYASYHPHFWASKGHFYGTHTPLYNFPYTFGYLFSAGVFAKASAEGPGFAPKYDALLRDTGRMTTEELASTHLGVDLTKPDFWRSAVDIFVAEIEEFLSL